MRLRSLILIICVLLVTGCGGNYRPSNPNNLCTIFEENEDWYAAALDSQKKWGQPLQIPMAIIKQESSFRGDALPPKDYLLGFIPWGRVSSAYGFAQVKSAAWSDYLKESGNWGAARDDFDDAMDFVGWYMNKTHKINGVSKWDAYGQYLNYHEGWGGYKNKSYRKKPWLVKVAKKVKRQASTYGAQYRKCKDDLNQGFWNWLF